MRRRGRFLVCMRREEEEYKMYVGGTRGKVCKISRYPG